MEKSIDAIDRVRHTLQAIDAYALEETLVDNAPNVGDIGSAWIGDNFETDPYLYFKLDRYAMNGNGYHVGYEEFVGKLRLYHKGDFAIHGIPYMLSPYVVFPATLEVHTVKPVEDPTEYTKQDALEYLKEYDDQFEDSAMVDLMYSDDEILQMAYDKGLGEGDYYPPDEDFAYHELAHHLEYILSKELVQPEFRPATSDEENSVWVLGRYYYEMGIMEHGREV